MTIKVYSSIMPGDPDEIHHAHDITIGEWVSRQAESYKPAERQPVSCSINGEIVPPGEWGEQVIREADTVEFRVVPFGGAADFIVPGWSLSYRAGKAAVKAIVDIPDIDQPGQGARGSRIEPAEARANTARLGEGVPEVFGKYIRYPDYLNSPRRYYADRTTQVLRMMLAVGVGEYEIDPDTVKIGETPISDLDQVEYEIFPPGADVSGNPAHENWFASSEVGATTASSGIRLKGVTFQERSYSGSATASGNQLSGIVAPETWTVGLIGSITLTQSVTVATGTADIITGAFQHLVAGITVNVTSDFGANGSYVVASINAGKTEITLETGVGDPVTGLDVGAGTMTIDKAGTAYELLGRSGGNTVTVSRFLSGGGADPDWSGQLPQASVTAEILWEASTSIGNRAGPFAACPAGETTDTVEVDIFAASGLGTVDGENINARTRTILIEWREVGALAWTPQTVTVSAATRDQLGWTFTINLPYAMRPEVQVARIGGESMAVTSLDRLEFTAMRAKLPTVTSYPEVTTMAVTITGSDEIGSGSNNRINLVPLRKLPELIGGAFGAPVPTRSISAATAYVAKSMGYADDQIDLDALEQLEAIWAPRGDTFDYVISSGTAKDAIDMILRAGFAEMTLDTGVIKPVRDQIRTKLEDGYSPENMTAPLTRSFEARQVDESDGVEVEYTDSETWTKETVLCLLPGDNQIKLDKIKVEGVTDRTRAWRIGMRRRRAQKYRRWTYSFNTELDALNSEYLSYVPLLDDVPGYGKVAILEGIEADRITVSEPMEFEPGKNHVVAYRAENGETIGPFPCTQGPDEYTLLVEIPQPWPAALPADREPTHVYFGTTERWHFPALITEISPSGPLQVGVTATNYDDRVYSDDNSSPP